MPALPSSVLEPLWVQLSALLPTRQDTHPLGCHRPRIPDRVVFDKLIQVLVFGCGQVLVFGCGYRRIADASCSATTLRRRRDEWIGGGVAEQLRLAVLVAYDRCSGWSWSTWRWRAASPRRPAAARLPGRARSTAANKLKRSVAVEAGGIPLAVLAAPANHRDDGLLAAILDAAATVTAAAVGSLAGEFTVHLDAGYDWAPCREVLAERGMVGEIATRGVPAPVQAGRRWVIECTHAWGNQYGKLRWCTERRRLVVEFWLALAGAAIVLGRLLRRAWAGYRWPGRPRRRP